MVTDQRFSGGNVDGSIDTENAVGADDATLMEVLGLSNVQSFYGFLRAHPHIGIGVAPKEFLS